MLLMQDNDFNLNSTSNETNNLCTLGITSPISIAKPKSIHIDRTNELKKALKLYNVFESEEKLKQKTEILSKLNAWVINNG